MTVSEGRPTQSEDRQASLRAELLGQIAAAQFDLEAVIADLTRDGAPAAALLDSRSQLSALTALSRQMGSVSGAALAEMRAEIASLVATSQSTAQQARTAAASKPDAAELIGRAQEVRAHVNEVMRGMKDFDPYLRFENERDEAEYRRREAENRAYIAAQQAKGTPEGDLNAAGAAVGQMADAHAHGAGDSPEFKKRWDELVASTEKLREEAKANGVSTEEFDNRLREDLRRILKSKGLSDAQIDAQLAAHADPLEAVKASIASESELSALERTAERGAPNFTAPVKAEQKDEVRDIFASLAAKGVSLSPAPDVPQHGVSLAATRDTIRTV